MPSKRRTAKGTPATPTKRAEKGQQRPTSTPALQDKGETVGDPVGRDERDVLARRGWRRHQVTFWTPPIPPATGLGLSSGTSWFGYALATHNVQPGFVWPSVVLIGMGMAYDLGRRALGN
jgi:hypothetical protein